MTAGARAAGHYVAFGITCVMMAVLVGYVYFTSKRRVGPELGRPWCNKFGPLVVTSCAVPLVLADQLRHVLQDTNVWPPGPWPGSSQYRPDCGSETMACLSAVGWVFTFAFTYTGFVLIAIGTMWNSNLLEKCGEFRAKWRELRGEAGQ